MRRIFFLLLVASCFSCSKRDVQLPKTTNQDVVNVYDVSPIYMFYNEENDSIEFNRKNMISTTNWLVNIDKRLTLKQILPHLQYLQNKRHGDGMHKNESARNYFTCHNTDIENLSFIDFTDVKFKQDTLFQFVLPKLVINDEGKPEKQGSSSKIITFSKDLSYYLDKKKYNKDSLNHLEQTHPNIKTITFGFTENLLYQDYITLKTNILGLEFNSIDISNEEIIYK